VKPAAKGKSEPIMQWFAGLDREQVQAVIEFVAGSLAEGPMQVWMRVLFDQGTPVPMRRFLKGHSVRTAEQQGWAHISNGTLLLLKIHELEHHQKWR
jgi:hypothetical protein